MLRLTKMIITETRPFPVPAEVVMRSTLFALANMQAKLQVYNEQTGVVVATVNRWLGLQTQEVVVKVHRFDDTSVLEMDAPDAEKAQELLTQISNYVRDGAGRVQADATIQWIDIANRNKRRAGQARWAARAKNLLGGGENDGNLPAVLDPQGNELVATGEADEMMPPVPIPDNPGVLVKNQQDKIIELKVDPIVFSDRSPYLEICQACSATVLRGSKYCPSCGRPLTLEAIQPAMQEQAHSAAKRSFRSGLLALLATIVPFIFLVFPEIVFDDASLSFLENVNESLTPVRLVLSLLLGWLPAVLLGYRAVSLAQQAGWYQNLDALFDDPGRLQSVVGRVAGWVAIYLTAAWILFVVVVFLFG